MMNAVFIAAMMFDGFSQHTSSFGYCVSTNDLSRAMDYGNNLKSGNRTSINKYSSDTDYLLDSYQKLIKPHSATFDLGPLNANRLAGKIDAVTKCDTPNWWIKQLLKRSYIQGPHAARLYKGYKICFSNCNTKGGAIFARYKDIDFNVTHAIDAIARESQIHSGILEITLHDRLLFAAIGIDTKLNYTLFCYNLDNDTIEWKGNVWGYSDLIELGPRIPRVEIVCGNHNVTLFADCVSALYFETFSVTQGKPVAKFNNKFWALNRIAIQK